jgi:cation diffusion facilitator CzcD-associated flavoprotein CzcO
LSLKADRTGPVAVVGAGPYGLAVAAHLQEAGVPRRVVGQPADYWRRHMPAGMFLKSSWRASSVASPRSSLSLPAFERMRGAAVPRPVPLQDFVEYLEWFQRAAVPDLDTRQVLRVDQDGDGFSVTFPGQVQVSAARVVLATGLRGFSYRPSVFDPLPSELVSHTEDTPPLERLAGRRVLVMGAGQSAIETAVLAHEAGAQVQVLVRAPDVHWLTRKARLDRWPARGLYAPSDVGPAGLSWLVAQPGVMRRLPAEARRRMTERCLRPAVTAWLLPRSEGVTFTCGRAVVAATATAGGVRVSLDDGSALEADHVLLGTGFRPGLDRMPMLAPALRAAIRTREGYPVLGPGFETSVPGLHAVGALAVESYGPVMRFVSGTWHAAPSLAAHLLRRNAARRRGVPVRSPVPGDGS